MSWGSKVEYKIYCMAPVQCKIFHNYAKETETHQYPHQIALSLLTLRVGTKCIQSCF